MKKTYNSPEMEVIVFEVLDVITTSGTDTDGWYKPEQNLGGSEGNIGTDGW